MDYLFHLVAQSFPAAWLGLFWCGPFFYRPTPACSRRGIRAPPSGLLARVIQNRFDHNGVSNKIIKWWWEPRWWWKPHGLRLVAFTPVCPGPWSRPVVPLCWTLGVDFTQKSCEVQGVRNSKNGCTICAVMCHVSLAGERDCGC